MGIAISGDISRVAVVTTHVRGLIATLITTHEPPSNHSPQVSDQTIKQIRRFSLTVWG